MKATVTTKPCPVCGESSEFTVDSDDWNRWRNGELIQNVWPDKSRHWREIMITGLHVECWDELFGPEEDDEDA